VSSKVHLRSPVRSFPCLWFTSWLGSPLGFCLSLSTPPLPAAQREVGTGVGHSPELESTRLLLLVSERLRVAPWVSPFTRMAGTVRVARVSPCRRFFPHLPHCPGEKGPGVRHPPPRFQRLRLCNAIATAPTSGASAPSSAGRRRTARAGTSIA